MQNFKFGKWEKNFSTLILLPTHSQNTIFNTAYHKLDMQSAPNSGQKTLNPSKSNNVFYDAKCGEMLATIFLTECSQAMNYRSTNMNDLKLKFQKW